MSDKTRRDDTYILENLLDCDPEDKENSDFMQAFLELASIDGIDVIITLSFDNLRTFYSRLIRDINFISWHNITGIKCIRSFLKILQEKSIFKLERISTISQLIKMTFVTSRITLLTIWEMEIILDLFSHLPLPENF